ncbi:MAG TPA: hypothetical protein VIM16_09420 [Mucilaginibacter sp.]
MKKSTVELAKDCGAGILEILKDGHNTEKEFHLTETELQSFADAYLKQELDGRGAVGVVAEDGYFVASTAVNIRHKKLFTRPPITSERELELQRRETVLHDKHEQQLAAANNTIEQLQAKVAELRDELSNIAKANRFDKERFENDSCFADWAQSRSRHTLALTSTQWLDNKLTEAKIEALEEAAVIAQTNSDSNVDGGDYACGCCYEIRRMAADVKGK